MQIKGFLLALFLGACVSSQGSERTSSVLDAPALSWVGVIGYETQQAFDRYWNTAGYKAFAVDAGRYCGAPRCDPGAYGYAAWKSNVEEAVAVALGWCKHARSVSGVSTGAGCEIVAVGRILIKDSRQLQDAMSLYRENEAATAEDLRYMLKARL